ncbi:MAG: hypothetical protein OJF50_004624 [Nitrospira sp.]|nr:hypothetical protein [Nitrospira sp.]
MKTPPPIGCDARENHVNFPPEICYWKRAGLASHENFGLEERHGSASSV